MVRSAILDIVSTLQGNGITHDDPRIIPVQERRKWKYTADNTPVWVSFSLSAGEVVQLALESRYAKNSKKVPREL